MKCEKIREGLLTDYLDGFLSQSDKQIYDDHLSECYHCRSYYEDVKATVSTPFRALAGEKPEVSVWHSIQTEILAKPGRRHSFSMDGFWDALQNFLTLKRVSVLIPAFAVVMVAVLPFLPSTGKSYRAAAGGYMIQSMEYNLGDLYDQEFGENGFGSAIEELLM